jgi:hypothetical protein
MTYETGAYRLPSDASPCQQGGCDEPAEVGCFCPRHAIERYVRSTIRQPLPARYKPAPRRRCSVDACERGAPSGGMCGRHRRQMERKGRVTHLPYSRRPGASQERDEQGRKECGMCLRWLPLDEYSSSPVYVDRLQPYCSTCTTATRYGLSQAQLTAMRDESGGRCSSCGSEEPDGHRLAVDHDHACCRGTRSCGRCVRGLLCGKCNRGLGCFNDQVGILRDAVAYLTSWDAAGLRSAPVEPPWSGKGARWAKYRLSTAAYEDLLTSQRGACAVCCNPAGSRALVVDHDHRCCARGGSCGRCVRGLLCGKCNTGLGMFKDSPELLSKAIAYLEKYAN